MDAENNETTEGEGEEEEEETEGTLPEEVGEENMGEESILTIYDPDDFVSGAVTSPDSCIPFDLFEFEYSYGYNCHKYFNLCACDDLVVCWAAGSIIVFLDVNTKQTWFRRSSTGGSIGAITSYRKDPNYRLAIAECREGYKEPIIILYTWPQMEIDVVLRDGTANAYSILDFSPDGELLASVGKEPDYNLTIWNWKRHKILLRTSAFTFDVNTVMFSLYCPGQLTTGGSAHIKFWKMAETFTGLKLKGDLGRFGKTEICDILGVYPMPDEKVLSGCEWGNVLVWEAGLVKLEVTRKGRKRCHEAPVIQFMLSPAGDEVTTISQDGFVRAWYWDTVEQADPPEDDPYVELNPVAETSVPGCRIMCLKHQKDMFWYAQDGNGGIWVVELEIDKIECNHRKVISCHAGGIVGMISLRTATILLTGGEDGALHVYNSETQMLQARYHFPAAITCMLYPPIDVDETSRIILVGFADGIVRTLLLHPERLQKRNDVIDIHVTSSLTLHSEDSVNADIMDLIALLKPHSKAITQISINNQRTLVVTCGEDSTLFMYKLMPTTPFSLEPLGFIETPNRIAYMTWKPDEEYVILLCGQVGLVMEAVLPKIDVRVYTEITTFALQFVSYKETLVKKHFLRRRPFPTEEDLASLDEEALKAQAEAGDEEEDEEEWLGEIELMESESMLGTTVTWAQYWQDGVWVVQRGTGALLLVRPGSNKIYKYAPVPDAWCDDITTLKFVCDNRFLMLGTNTGYIRVFRMPTEEEDSPDYHRIVWMTAMEKLMKKLKGRRLAKEEKQPIPRIDFKDQYYLPMHDRYTGAITCLEIGARGRRLYSCGADGNIFSYIINFSEPLLPIPKIPEEPEEMPKIKKIHEPSTAEGEMMSHEQLKQKEEYDKMMAIANAHKKRVRDQLAELSAEYNKLIRANRALPASQQIDVTLDSRPLVEQERELEQAKALTIRKLAHQLEASDIGLRKMHSRNIIQLDVYPFTVTAIRDPQVTIRPLRQKNLSRDFFAQLEEVRAKMAEAALRGRKTETAARRIGPRKASYAPPRVASFLLGLPPKPPHPLKKALRNYHERMARHHLQFTEWQEHMNRKPDPNAMPPGAAEALKEAEESIGNKLLKTQPDYVAPPGHNTQLRVCITREEIYNNKRYFNEKVLNLRERKVQMVAKMTKLGERLAEIQMEIPPRYAKTAPLIPEINEELEFPEKHLEIKPEPVQLPTRVSKKVQQVQERRKSAIYTQHAIRQRAPRVHKFIPITESRPLAASWELLRPRQDQEPTPMEVEIRERRIIRHLYEQDMLLADAELSIQQFDARLVQLQRERIRVQEKNQLLELHLCQLHREMNVLNRFEAHEDRLAHRVYTKLMQVKAVQDLIEDCEHRIDQHLGEKEALAEECANLQVKFKTLVQDNNFADFLRRIFKKKYRPPRNREDDESSESESSSSSSEEEEDEGSLDSRDIGPIRLDPNICPEGCSQEIYDKTYELRNTRHKHEQDMLEKDKLIELLRRDIDNHNKYKRKLSTTLDKRKNDLKEFMMEKQSCMNEVEQVVVLRYEQMRASAIRGCTGPQGLSNCVVFPEAMLARLRRRVLELQDEIRQQKLRQKVNRTHLFRMNVDIRAMEARAAELRAQMRDVLTRKLGRPRHVERTLDDLLRQMARRHKFRHTHAVRKQLFAQLRAWQKRHGEMEKKYIEALNYHSDRLRLAASIQGDVLPHKPAKDPKVMVGGYNVDDYERDVIRLRIVRSRQRQQIEQLRQEIQSLRMKPMAYYEKPQTLSRSESETSEIYLRMIPRNFRDRRKKYFPITPLQSQTEMICDVNVMRLLFDTLDAMRMSRDDAQDLLADVNGLLPDIIAGLSTRYDVVDELVKKWLGKRGGDPAKYKKQTKVFDAMAALTDRLVRQQIQEMKDLGMTGLSAVLLNLESALKRVSDINLPLASRLGPTMAALLHSAEIEDVKTAETMSTLVKALVDESHPLTQESIDCISCHDIMEDMKDCGIDLPQDELADIVQLAINSLKAQLVGEEEADEIEEEVTEAMEGAQKQTVVKPEHDTDKKNEDAKKYEEDGSRKRPSHARRSSRDARASRDKRPSRAGPTFERRLSLDRRHSQERRPSQDTRASQSSLKRLSLVGSKLTKATITPAPTDHPSGPTSILMEPASSHTTVRSKLSTVQITLPSSVEQMQEVKPKQTQVEFQDDKPDED